MEPGATSASGEARLLRIGTPIAVTLLAFAVRSLSWPSVTAGTRVELPDTDGYYHLRRIVWALLNAPESLGFDRFLNFPHGARAIWPPFLDSAIAREVAPFVGTGGVVDVAGVERLVVWVPPLLGALTVLATYGWARRHFGYAVAAMAGGLLGVLSGSVWYARVGMIDHHVAVALLGSVLLGLAMDLLRPESRRASVAWRAVAMGVLFAVMLHVWPGGLLHVVLLLAGGVLFWLTRRERAAAVAAGWVLGGIQGVACLVLLASGWPPPGHWGDYATVVLSRSQPLLLGCGALLVLTCSLGWRRTSLASTRARRAVLVLVLGAGITGLALLLLAGLREGIADAWTWLGRGERFQGSVLESRPLLLADGELDTRLASARLSYFVFVFPLAWVWLVVRELRGARRAPLLLLAGVAAALALATLLQARFFNSFAAPLAVWFALAVRSAYQRLALRAGRVVAAAALGVLTLGLCWPTLEVHRPALTNFLRSLRGQDLVHTAEDRYWQALFETAAWLRRATPSPGDAYDPEAEPSFGVLGHWQYGHLLQYVAERPAVVGNFGDDVGGDNYALSFEYFEKTEARAVEILDALRARYVVIRPLDVARGDRGPGSMIRRLADPNGGALARHRLVYERRVLHGREEGTRSHFRVFERVAGALVIGVAKPGTVVEARLGYVSPTGRRGEFRRTATTRDTGVYRLRLPYATRDPAGVLALEPAWRVGVEGSGVLHPVPIEESEVQRGGRVPGPDFL